MSLPTKPLLKFEDVKAYFSNLTTPIYFLGATNFNLLNLENWVKNWTSINLIDCFDGLNSSIILPINRGSTVFESSQAINAFLLNHPDVAALIKKNALMGNLQSDQAQGQAVFLFFNDEIEKACIALNLKLALPSFSTVTEVDSKIITTQIANEAGVASVPNTLAKVSSYDELTAISDYYGLGEHLVVQTPYGDSGKTTFFISNCEDYDRVAEKIEAEKKVKIMRRIRCASAAIEGCTTRCGTFVGPLLTELIGFSELTPYQGGWCGNELYQAAFSDSIRQQAQEMTEQLGDILYQRDYRGYFEVDYLLDLDSGELYLGEINPRITGISAMTNLCDFSYKTLPLFLWHLLEFSEVNFAIDPSEYNQLALEKGAKTIASQLIFKYREQGLQVITQAPISGVYQFDEGTKKLVLKKASYQRREALAPNEVFLMRIMNEQEYIYPGADMAIVFTNTILKTPAEKLTPSALLLVNAVHATFSFRDLTTEEINLVNRYNPASSIKMTSMNETIN